MSCEVQCSDGLVSLYYVLSYLLLVLLSDTKVQGFEPSAVLTYIHILGLFM